MVVEWFRSSRPLLLGALVLAFSCAGSGLGLSVDLKTDWQPGRQFVGVRTEFGTGTGGTFSRIGPAQETVATSGQDFITGRRIAEVEGLEPGEYVVRVSLLASDGSVLASRDTLLELSGSFALTVLMTSSCGDLECPMEGDSPELTSCSGGRCVDPRCSPETPDFCGEPSCTTDDECGAGVFCSMGICVENECLLRADDSACEPGFVCDLDEGCTLATGVDGGPGCPATETSCTDGLDDDCDGDIDCADADCAGVSCDDGSACTEGDVCSAGTCGGTAIDCDDGNECTDDSCDPDTGCTNDPNTAACDDGTWCNGTDSCRDGLCQDHADPPCADFCNEAAMACDMCRNDSDCGSVTYGSWSSCGGFSGTCGESGTQSRSVMTPRCDAGACVVDASTETRSCSRDTDGTSCGSTTYGSWSSCGGYSSTCDETGTRSRSVTTRTCGSGSCQSNTSTQNGSCTRDTDGTSCGSTTYGSWSSCGGFSGTCDSTGTQSRSVTTRTCGTGSCRSNGSSQSRSCSRTVNNGTSCGTNRVCCGSSCTSITSNSNCGACGVSCSAQGLTCASTGTGGYSCRSCTSNAQCQAELNGSATCWNVSSPPAFCQCQCPSNGVCANGGCGSGFYCHDESGHNYCSPNP